MSSPLAVLTCFGGDGGVCGTQNGSLYEVGLLAGTIAADAGTSTQEFTSPWNNENACAAVALKGIGH